MSNGERDKDDAWQGKIMMACWDGISDDIVLLEDQKQVHTENWRAMSGL